MLGFISEHQKTVLFHGFRCKAMGFRGLEMLFIF